jgi:hypothetical protein
MSGYGRGGIRRRSPDHLRGCEEAKQFRLYPGIDPAMLSQ